jgi:GTP-binding protein EngB required for normal cell division
MIKEKVPYSDVFFEEANKVLQTLNDFRDLSEVKLNNQQLMEIFKKINADVSNGIDKIQMNLNFLVKNVEWDTFNISFFGETNAGKSTLIEALLKGNGESIGDGRKDFTKTLNSRSLKNINLLDMPGIEGNERKYISEIKKGVQKSHVVFYVLGTNKEPEEETLKKIHSFLKDQARVYSIINVRGKPTVYLREKGIYDENIKKIEARTKEKFQRILGEHYVDNLVINAHIAFLSTGNPSREDLKRDKVKLIKIFGTEQNAYEFSNLQAVERLISDLAKSSLDEIVLSNTYKFFSCLEGVVGRILRGKKDLDETIKGIKIQIKEIMCKSEQIIKNYSDEIINLVERKIDKMKIDMQQVIYEGIDNEWSEGVIKRKLNETKANFEQTMNAELKNMIDELHKDITDIMQQLEKRIDLNFKFKGIDNRDFNIEEIFKNMKVSVNYVLKQILDIGLSAFGVFTAFLLNPILGIITGVVSSLKKVWEWFFGDPYKRKREAKDKAYNEITSTINDIKHDVLKNTEREIKNLKNLIKKQLLGMNSFIDEIEKLSFSLNDKILNLTKSKVEISKALASFIEKHPVDYAYFDLQLKAGLIIGKELPITDRNVFRLKELSTFPSFNDYLNSLDYYIEEDYFMYLQSPTEFTYRATNSLIDYFKDRDKSLKIRGVRRKRS